MITIILLIFKLNCLGHIINDNLSLSILTFKSLMSLCIMSAKDDIFVTPPEKKLRFRSTTKLHYNNENKVEDLFSQVDYKQKMEERTTNEPECKKKENTPSLCSFLRVELTRGYLLENDEEQYSARREKVYSFMKIPREVEKFMVYGFLQCADSFLFVYTFLPVRFLLAFWTLITCPFKNCFGLLRRPGKRYLKPAEICDLLKACIIFICSIGMFYLDTNMLYHMIKSQSVIKLYIFYNMLEVGDRLFSAFGQDIIDALFWTATEPRDRHREHLGVIPHLFFAIAYVFLHSLLVLFQATTLNVAMNSNNKALLTIMMSNNFVELKGSVFKKFDKNNLFQVTCSDVRERFHLFVLLFIVVLQTMKEYSWKEDRFWVLMMDCLIVLFAEVLVDWIKHAFITRFNELPVDVYRDYTTSLAYDVAQTRQKNAFSDHSDLVARRMGFIPMPLGVVMFRVVVHALYIEGAAAIILVFLGYLCLVSVRILNGLVILGKACDLITAHRQDKTNTQSPSSVRANSPVLSPLNGKLPSVVNKESTKDNCASPFKPFSSLIQRSQTIDVVRQTEEKNKNVNSLDPILGVTAIFSNSTVNLKDVCLNEELLKVTDNCIEIQSNDTQKDDSVTRSVPNIQSEFSEEVLETLADLVSNVGDSAMKKRAESEPSIVSATEEEEKT